MGARYRQPSHCTQQSQVRRRHWGEGLESKFFRSPKRPGPEAADTPPGAYMFFPRLLSQPVLGQETRKFHSKSMEVAAQNTSMVIGRYQPMFSKSLRDGLDWRFPPGRACQVAAVGTGFETSGAGGGSWATPGVTGAGRDAKMRSITHIMSSTASSNVPRSSVDLREAAHQVVDITTRNMPF